MYSQDIPSNHSIKSSEKVGHLVFIPRGLRSLKTGASGVPDLCDTLALLIRPIAAWSYPQEPNLFPIVQSFYEY